MSDAVVRAVTQATGIPGTPAARRSGAVTLHLAVLIAYSLALMALGLWIGRRVRGASDFFVAGRRLGPGLLFSTMLAANIGAGSTVGATALGYSNGVAAWWWVGSAACGSVVLAFWIGPAIRRVAAAENLRTVGDYLEFRYGPSVRGIIAVIVWIGSIFFLASQLIGLGWILNVVTGLPKPIGCIIGGIVITVYFAAGGLLTSAWVNVVQLIVESPDLRSLCRWRSRASAAGGGIAAVRPAYDTDMLDVLAVRHIRRHVSGDSRSGVRGTPPGLLQKIFGARDDRAVHCSASGLNMPAGSRLPSVPCSLGVIARSQFPNLPGPPIWRCR